MWPSPCSPTRTVPSSVYSRSSGPFRPEASSRTGYAEDTPDATGRATGCTHAGGLGDGEGVWRGEGEGVGCAATFELLHATAHASTTTSAVRFLHRGPRELTAQPQTRGPRELTAQPQSSWGLVRGD